MERSPSNTLEYANSYVKGVLTGDIPACELVRLAVERHERDRQTVESGESTYLHFDEPAANRACSFFDFLKHSKGEWVGQPFELSGWQAFILASLFGWKRADGTRRFRRALIEVPRKNGKTTFLAGIGLFLLVADKEGGPEVYSAATKRDQARLTHSEAVRMVKASPSLRKIVRSVRDNLHIVGTAAKFEPLGADSDTMDGLNVHGAIIDELHAHKTRDVWDVLDTATGSRRQPLIVAITTAGFNQQSVCWEQHSYCDQILRGVIEDDAYFAFIACLDEDDDWRDEEVWEKANPNFGVSVKIDDLRELARKAERQPGAQNAFRRLRLNEWTQQEDRWLDLEAWDETAGDLDQHELAEHCRGRLCYGGLDLANTTDINAFLLVFPPETDEDPFDVLARFWIPRESMRERVKTDRVPYDIWARQGWVEATPGNVVDHEQIRATINELVTESLHQIAEIAFDRWGSVQMSVGLQADGFTMVQFGQGFASMSAPTKALEELVLSKRLRHGGNPVLRWMADNVVVEQDAAGNLKPAKNKSREKIDGIVALIMALDRAQRNEGKPTRSVYEDRGIRTT